MSGYTVTLTDREYDALKDRIRTLEDALARAEVTLRHWFPAYTGDVADSDDVPRGTAGKTQLHVTYQGENGYVWHQNCGCDRCQQEYHRIAMAQAKTT